MRAFGDFSGTERSFGGRRLGVRGAVATEHYLSAQAGMDMLSQGGNAFDAAVAAVFAEAVVNPHMFGLGGECPMLVCPAGSDRVEAVNGNTMAPEQATLEAYLRLGLALVPPDGVLAAGVPSAVHALCSVLERHGTLPMGTVLEPALALAREGFPVHEGLWGMPGFGLRDLAPRFSSQWPGSARIYLREGRPLGPGEVLANASLAEVLDAMARAASGARTREAGIRAARDFYYLGDVAREFDEFSRRNDGFLRLSDFSRFETLFEAPAAIRFRGAEVHKCGPWSQGPVFLQLLGLMDGWDLKALGHNSADYLHLWLEAAKLAFADREQFYADPAQVEVPMEGLLSEEYAKDRRELIDMRRANRDFRPGDPHRRTPLLPRERVFRLESWGYGTVHVAVADARGNVAACTPSGGWLAGNDTVPSLGFGLGTRLQTFYLDSRHPNMPAPFKRPRTSLSPSLAVYRNADPARSWKMAFGTMGGDQQDQWTSQFFLNRLVFGMGVQEAIEAPKVTSYHFPGIFHPHSAFPGRACVEDRIPEDIRRELASRGHEVMVHPGWSAGFVCAAVRYGSGLVEAGADPRGEKAGVFPAAALARQEAAWGSGSRGNRGGASVVSVG